MFGVFRVFDKIIKKFRKMPPSSVESHSLLEPSTPAYTNATVRRAFIVWMHCGQKNSFKDVCNYYHYLECLENKLPADHRASSRHHEFNMFTNPPPTSPYLDENYPQLYTQSHQIQHYIKKVEAINNPFIHEDAKLKNTLNSNLKIESLLNDMKQDVTNEILETSQMIKKYCTTYMKPLKKFLQEFNDNAKKCNLNATVNNVAFYIKRKMVEEELQMVANYSRTVRFLDLNNKDTKKNILKKDKTVNFFEEFVKNLNGNYYDFGITRKYMSRT